MYIWRMIFLLNFQWSDIFENFQPPIRQILNTKSWHFHPLPHRDGFLPCAISVRLYNHKPLLSRLFVVWTIWNANFISHHQTLFHVRCPVVNRHSSPYFSLLISIPFLPARRKISDDISWWCKNNSIPIRQNDFCKSIILFSLIKIQKMQQFLLPQILQCIKYNENWSLKDTLSGFACFVACTASNFLSLLVLRPTNPCNKREGCKNV